MLKKVLKYLLWGLLVGLFLFGILFWQLGNYLELQDDPQQADAIVVISGGGMERIEKGITLLKDDYASYLVLSGAAYDDGTSNAASMRLFALQSGVPDEQILLDEDSLNTYENAFDVEKILKEHNLKKIILVTSSYHQRRAYNTFKYVLGDENEIINVPAKPDFWDASLWWKNDKSKHLVLTEIVKILYSAFSGNYGQET